MYKSRDDFPPSLAGIEPAVSVEQGNAIARCADKVQGVESPWNTCIGVFKKSHEPRNGKWIAKEAEQGTEVDDAEEALRRLCPEMSRESLRWIVGSDDGDSLKETMCSDDVGTLKLWSAAKKSLKSHSEKRTNESARSRRVRLLE